MCCELICTENKQIVTGLQMQDRVSRTARRSQEEIGQSIYGLETEIQQVNDPISTNHEGDHTNQTNLGFKTQSELQNSTYVLLRHLATTLQLLHRIYIS